MLSVGATGPTNQADFDALAPYSNHGLRGADVTAPGGNSGTGDIRDGILSVCSTYSFFLPVCSANGFYLIGGTGTSFAAPHAAGAAAVYEAEKRKNVNGKKLGRCVEDGADDLGAPGKRDPIYGTGRPGVLRGRVSSSAGSESHPLQAVRVDYRRSQTPAEVDMGNRLAAVLCIVAPSVVAACQAQDVPTDLPNVPVDAVAVQFQTIERITSPIGGPPEAERRVIRDDASWLAFWRQLTGAIVPPPEPPAIDFSSEMVLVAAMGRRPTGGYAITIEGVYEQTGTLYVDVLAQSPAASCMVIQMLTAPVTAVRLTQHTGDVRFLDRSESTGCG